MIKTQVVTAPPEPQAVDPSREARRQVEFSTPLGRAWQFPEDRTDYHPLPEADLLHLPPNLLNSLRPPMQASQEAARRHTKWTKLANEPNAAKFFAAASAPTDGLVNQALAEFKVKIAQNNRAIAALRASAASDPAQIEVHERRNATHHAQLQILGAATVLAPGTPHATIEKLLALTAAGLRLSGVLALDESALHLAVRNGLDGTELATLVTYLLACGVPVDAKDAAQETACHRLAHLRHADPMPALRALVTSGADLAAQNADGQTPLALILQRPLDGCRLFEQLRAFNPDLTGISPLRQQNLLHTVVAHHDAPHIVGALLRAGVSAIHEDCFGLTPWDQAAMLGRSASVEAMRQHALRQLGMASEPLPEG